MCLKIKQDNMLQNELLDEGVIFYCGSGKDFLILNPKNMRAQVLWRPAEETVISDVCDLFNNFKTQCRKTKSHHRYLFHFGFLLPECLQSSTWLSLFVLVSNFRIIFVRIAYQHSLFQWFWGLWNHHSLYVTSFHLIVCFLSYFFILECAF